MTDETAHDQGRPPMQQETISRGLFGVCFQVAWARAARDARHRRPHRRGGGMRDVSATRGAVDMTADGENVFERVLI